MPPTRLNLHFAPHFLDVRAGPSIMRDPVTALVELVANAWDSGATEVHIRWPDEELGRTFCVTDNGHGMTESEFEERWLSVE
jgi:DNA mismatch repair ATPase MutL